MSGSVLGRVVLQCRVHISYAIRSAVCSGTVQLGGVVVVLTLSSRILRVDSGTDSGHVYELVCSGTVQLGWLIIMYTMSSRVLRVVSGTDSGHVHSCVSSGSIQLWWIVVGYVYGCMRCR